MGTLDAMQRAQLRALLEQRLHALLQVEDAEADDGGAAPAEPETSPLDRATVRLLNDLTRDAADQHATEVRRLRHALAKFDDDGYGLCEACGQAIGWSRLQARPEARLCIACQTRADGRRRP